MEPESSLPYSHVPVSLHISLFTLTIYVNYTSYFREFFEATTYTAENLLSPVIDYFNISNYHMS